MREVVSTGYTDIYCMLLRKLGCNAFGCHRNRYMTIAQLHVAKTGHALFLAILYRFSSCISPHPPLLSLNLAARPYISPTPATGPEARGVRANFVSPRSTRAKMYMTICWLMAFFVRPNTTYPPRRPATSESNRPSLPEIERSANTVDL